jgi:hypothetical protein
MDGRTVEERQPPSRSKLEEIARGSMVQVADPDGSWYWVIVERRFEDGWLQGRIDAHCLLSPALRHGGTVMFHEDNIFFLWPRKVKPIFDSLWFRFLSGWISFGARVKPLKRLTGVNGSTLYQFSASAR